MSFLRHIARLVSTAPQPRATAVTAMGNVVGHFLRRPTAAAWPSVSAIADTQQMAFNDFEPEAGTDPAPLAHPVDSGRGNPSATVEPQEVVGNSETRSTSIQQRPSQESSSSRSFERLVSNPGAKYWSEKEAQSYSGPPSLLPAQPSSMAPVVQAGAIQSASAPPVPITATANTPAGVATGVESAAARAPFPEQSAEAPGAADAVLATYVRQAAGRVSPLLVQALDSMASASTAQPYAAHMQQPASPAVSSQQLPPPELPEAAARQPLSLPPLLVITQPSPAAEAFGTTMHVAGAAAAFVPRNVASPEPARVLPSAAYPSAATVREASAPEPVVHIGSIEIVVEAPPPARQTSALPMRGPDFSSRHYLRRL